MSAREILQSDQYRRVNVIDILRGFALIGICMMNIEWFGRSISEFGQIDYTLEGADWTAAWLNRLLVEGKFYKIFALLFGMSFAIMLIKAERQSGSFAINFTRRLLGLFFIGVFHLVFLWQGDILHDYAGAGLVLLAWIYLIKTPMMQWASSTQNFLRIGLVTLFIPFFISVFSIVQQGTKTVDESLRADFHLAVAVDERVVTLRNDKILSATLVAQAKSELDGTQVHVAPDLTHYNTQQLIEYRANRQFIERYIHNVKRSEEVNALRSDSYWSGVNYRWSQISNEISKTPKFAFMLCFPLFLLGYWFVRSGVILNPSQHKPIFVYMTFIGLGVGLLTGATGLAGVTHPIIKQIPMLEQSSLLLYMFSHIFLSAGYIGLMVLLYISQFTRQWLVWLRPMGKMTMSNYIMQSLILVFIFYGFAGGLYGELLRANQMVVVMCIIAFQAIFSYVWLKHCYYGPFEWLWRCFTELKFKPLKKSVETKKSVAQDRAVNIGY